MPDSRICSAALTTAEVGAGSQATGSIGLGRKVARLLRPVSLVAAATALFWPGLALGPALDAAVFILAGSRIRDGYLPYLDLWDHKPPGAYLLNAFGQAVFPWMDSWVVCWLLTLAFTSASVLLMDRLLRRRLSALGSWVGSLVFCVGVACYPIALGGGYTESFALLPLVFALWVMAALPRDGRTATVIGLALSCACLISLQCVPAAMVLAAAAVWTESRGFVAGRRAAALVAGALPLPLAVSAWLVVGGAGGDAVDQILAYNAAYRDPASQLLAQLPLVGWLCGGLAILIAVAVMRLLHRPRAYDRVDWACLTWCLSYAAYIVFEGRFFLHYLILIMPPVVLLAGRGLHGLLRQMERPKYVLRRWLAVGVAIEVAVAFALSAAEFLTLNGSTQAVAASTRKVTVTTDAWIRGHTPASATLFVWGDNAALHLASDRKPYGRYVYQFPIVTPTYWSTGRTAALLAAWSKSPPSVIIESPSDVPMFRPAVPLDDRVLDTLAPLRDFVAANYRLAATFGGSGDFGDIYVYVVHVAPAP